MIFGGGGDLAWRKLIPALYNLWLDKSLAEPFKVVALDIKEMDPAVYVQHLREGVDQFSRRGKAEDEPWQRFAAHLEYLRADFADAAAVQAWPRSWTPSTAEWASRPPASSTSPLRPR